VSFPRCCLLRSAILTGRVGLGMLLLVALVRGWLASDGWDLVLCVGQTCAVKQILPATAPSG